jgi:hypothetical protein
MGRLVERLGDREAAEGWYRRIVERYEVRTELLDFYLRQEQRYGDGRYASEAVEARREIFPGGLERFGEGSVSGEPARDQAYTVSALDFDERVRRIGLRPGDRIVAVDGFRVRNEMQFLCVRSFRDDRTMSLVVWRDSRLVAFDGYYPRYGYGPARP